VVVVVLVIVVVLVAVVVVVVDVVVDVVVVTGRIIPAPSRTVQTPAKAEGLIESNG